MKKPLNTVSDVLVKLDHAQMQMLLALIAELKNIIEQEHLKQLGEYLKELEQSWHQRIENQ